MRRRFRVIATRDREDPTNQLRHTSFVGNGVDHHATTGQVGHDAPDVFEKVLERVPRIPVLRLPPELLPQVVWMFGAEREQVTQVTFRTQLSAKPLRDCGSGLLETCHLTQVPGHDHIDLWFGELRFQ
jgi:hypothetical protein